MLRCYVTDRKRADVVSCARKAVEDHVDLIQIREKDLDAHQLLRLVARVVEMTRGSSTRVLVNDRLDVALATGADGVHLPANGLPVERVRPLIDLVGVSTHGVEEALRAEKGGADFVVFGPVFETPGKSPVGLERLRQVTRTVRVPVLAIGGVTPELADRAVEAGAAGIAAIRMFQEA